MGKKTCKQTSSSNYCTRNKVCPLLTGFCGNHPVILLQKLKRNCEGETLLMQVARFSEVVRVEIWAAVWNLPGCAMLTTLFRAWLLSLKIE